MAPRPLLHECPAGPARSRVLSGSRVSRTALGIAAAGRHWPPQRRKCGTSCQDPYGGCSRSARHDLSLSSLAAPVAANGRASSGSMCSRVPRALVDEIRTRTTVSRWCAAHTSDNSRQHTGGGFGDERAQAEGGILARAPEPPHRDRLLARRARQPTFRGDDLGCRRWSLTCGTCCSRWRCAL